MTLCRALHRANARFRALHSQNETEIIQFSTAASRAVRSARSDDACRIHTRNAAAVSLKSAYPLSAGSSSCASYVEYWCLRDFRDVRFPVLWRSCVYSSITRRRTCCKSRANSRESSGYSCAEGRPPMPYGDTPLRIALRDTLALPFTSDTAARRGDFPPRPPTGASRSFSRSYLTHQSGSGSSESFRRNR